MCNKANRLIKVTKNWPAHADQIETPKTPESVRDIDMCSDLAPVLKELIRKRKRDAFKGGSTEFDWLFVSKKGKRVDYDNFRIRTWYHVLDKAEIRRRGIHQLRHSFACHLLMLGSSILYVSKMLGHSSAHTTMRIYARYIPEKNREREVDRLSGTIRLDTSSDDFKALDKLGRSA